MKYISNLMVMGILLAVTAGCNQSNSDQSPASTNTTASSALDTAHDYAAAAVTNTVNAATQAWAEVKESFQSAMGYSYDKKDQFVAQAHADMQVLDQKMKVLSDKAANATDATKADIQTQMEDLRQKRGVLDQKMASVQALTEANWEDAKQDFKNAYYDTKTSLQNAWHRLTGS